MEYVGYVAIASAGVLATVGLLEWQRVKSRGL